MTLMIPMVNTTGLSATDTRRNGTQAIAKATRLAIPPPRMMTRKEPASADPERVAGSRAARTILDSGAYAQITTGQNTGQ